eukprot:12162083-Prorocentrum_lima.AAC.1
MTVPSKGANVMRTLQKPPGPIVTPRAAPGAWCAPEHETLAGRVEVLGGVPRASASYGLRHMPFP